MTREGRAALLFAGPVLALILLLFLLPTGAALLLSLTDFDIYGMGDLGTVRFTGAQSFARLFSDPLFWRALGNTLLFAALGTPAAVGASLVAALMLHAATSRWSGVWRVALFAPYVTSVVATAVVWRYLLDTRFGLLNAALGVVHLPAVDWLGDPRASIPAILVFTTWKEFGYNMVVFSAALSVVPQDLVEAARLDGAGAWTRFRHVTLPAIAPMLVLALLLSASGFLQLFDQPYVMTQGGPAQSTTTLVYFMFKQGFEWWNLSGGAAVAVVLFGLTMVVARVQVRFSRGMLSS